MSTQPIEPVDLILRGQTQVAASVPYLLGFQPTDSIVAVFASTQGRHVLTARLDLPDPLIQPAALFDALMSVCARADQQGARHACFILYPPESSASPDVPVVVSTLQAAVGESTLSLEGISTVHRGLVRDELDPARQASVLRDAGLATRAQWMARGASYEASRVTLEARIGGPATPLAQHVESFIASQTAGWSRSVVRNARVRRLLEDEILDYLLLSSDRVTLGQGAADSELPCAATLAGWAVGLSDSRVREPVLWRLAQGCSGAVSREFENEHSLLMAMCALVRNVPGKYAAPMASCVAAYSWQLGNGAMARIAADHGLAADPDNVLCRLVAEAVKSGVHPDVWLEMLASMSLRELRSGPRVRRPG